MRFNALLLAATIMAAALAGCTSEEPAPEDDPCGDAGSHMMPDGTVMCNDDSAMDDDHMDDGAGNGTTDDDRQKATSDDVDDGNETENKPPTLTFTADRSAGQIPFNVTFSLTGADPEGDPISWSVDLDGNEEASGDALPTNVTIDFDSVGNYTVTAVVDDGDMSINASLVIVATAEEAVYDGPAPIVWSGSALAGDHMVGFGCLVYDSSDGGLYLYYEASYAGVWSYHVEGAPTAGGVLTEWWNGDGSAGTGGADGTIPAPSDNVAVCSDTPSDPMDFTLTLYHPDDPSVSF